MRYENYIEDCLAQKTVLDIESYIDYWHQNDTGVSLRDFLGFDAEEMDMWLRGSDCLIVDFLKARAKSKGIDFPINGSLGLANKEKPLRYRIMRFAVDEGSISERVKAAYSERDAEFVKEMQRLFTGDGWQEVPGMKSEMRMRLKKGKETLLITPLYFDARVAERNITGFQKLLDRIKTYPIKCVFIGSSIFDISSDSLITRLEAQKDKIVNDLLEEYRVDIGDTCFHEFGPLDDVCGKYVIDCMTVDGRPDYSGTDFIVEIFEILVERGEIIAEKDGDCDIFYHTAPDAKDGETMAKDISSADKTA